MNELVKKIKLPKKGKYVIAVSGGVDSMSLLHLLNGEPGYELIVAHVNHGIRDDSSKDEELVREVASKCGLEFEATHLGLDRSASEEKARKSRYAFLFEILNKHQAAGIILAHHLDDRVETMLLNKQRGAGWIGLAPLHETGQIKRPLLRVTKKEIYDYAHKHKVLWREDETNFDPDFTPRNRLRSTLSDKDRQTLYERLAKYDAKRARNIQEAKKAVRQIASFKSSTILIDSEKLLMYDVSTARDALFVLLREYFASWMEVDYDAVVRLEHFIKTAGSGKRLPLSAKVWAHKQADKVTLELNS